ncbi:glycosyltransferase family 4 protein [Microbacterium sp. E-13]|uniref:glycosyltransferase family 4 protein n=1 Tax=Microbacterium sp. E-13 TaxID=3404048 RepID=UPI003CEAB079
MGADDLRAGGLPVPPAGDDPGGAIAGPRVLHLDHTAVAGGAELALARMLSAGPSWHPFLLTPPTTGPAFDRLDGAVERGVSGIPQPAGVSSGRRGATIAAAASLLVQAAATRVHREYRRADLVDANSARAAAYGALAARASRTPFVVHLRDTVDAAALGEVGSAIMRRLVLPRADGVVGNSRLTLQTALPFLRPGAATVVIPSASGLRAGPPVPGPREPGPLRVGMLARIDPWKGQALLIEAFAAAFPGDTVLEIAGAAPFGHEDHREELRTQAERLGVADRVAFLGHVDDVDALLARWDVAVQYSTRPEPLGQNVLQYLAAGRAVVVADEGGPVEWVDDGVNGLRAAPRDVPALTAALRRIGGDPVLRARLASAAAATPGLLSDAEVVDAHALFYAEVLHRRDGMRRGGLSPAAHR